MAWNTNVDADREFRKYKILSPLWQSLKSYLGYELWKGEGGCMSGGGEVKRKGGGTSVVGKKRKEKRNEEVWYVGGGKKKLGGKWKKWGILGVVKKINKNNKNILKNKIVK